MQLAECADVSRALVLRGMERPWLHKKADLIDVAKLPDVKASVSNVKMEDGWDVIMLIRSDSHTSK